MKLWPCRHRRVTFPIRAHGEGERAAHVTCLDCGREFWYDWERMRRGTERKRAVELAEPPALDWRGPRAA